MQFTRESYLFDFYQTAAPFQSSTEQAENDAVICGETATRYDDRLGEITIPVLYVGAGGGFGEYRADTLARLGSADATSHLVNLYGPGARPAEFGHADLLMADNAKDFVWAPVYEWIAGH